MGSSIEYLTGIASMSFITPKKNAVRDIMLVNAPSDVVLFEMLKNAKWTSKHIDWSSENYGYDLNLMPDTVYMIWMIFYFKPDHDLWKAQLNQLDYFPVLYRNSAWKFNSPEIRDYQHLTHLMNKEKFPVLSWMIRVLIQHEEQLELGVSQVVEEGTVIYYKD